MVKGQIGEGKYQARWHIAARRRTYPVLGVARGASRVGVSLPVGTRASCRTKHYTA